MLLWHQITRSNGSSLAGCSISAFTMSKPTQAPSNPSGSYDKSRDGNVISMPKSSDFHLDGFTFVKGDLKATDIRELLTNHGTSTPQVSTQYVVRRRLVRLFQSANFYAHFSQFAKKALAGRPSMGQSETGGECRVVLQRGTT